MKKLLTLILICIAITPVFAQHIKENSALVLIDIQDFYFPGGEVALEEPEAAATNAAELLDLFRKEGLMVVHVRHEYEPGGNINTIVAPNPGEKVISKSEVNAFLNTDLLEYLNQNNIENLVLCGMQTHMCLEAATRAAHDFGFECMVISDACTTRDLQFGDQNVKAKDVHASTLKTLQSYSEIISTGEFISKNE
jgi:nicotinamidase-related amidase